jgi:hypothetical protein
MPLWTSPRLIEGHCVADLRVADLRVADLRVADLRVADLRVADLRVADLRVADLAGAGPRRWRTLAAPIDTLERSRDPELHFRAPSR